MRVLRLLGLLPLLALSACHAGIGPTIGYVKDQGLSVGWEANAGWAALQGDVGQSFRPSGGGPARYATYAVAEPGLGLPLTSLRPDLDEGGALSFGPTLGVGWDAAQRSSFVGGFWASGFTRLNDGARCDDGVPFASLAIGVRNLGEPEFYLAPKLAVMFACPDIDL